MWKKIVNAGTSGDQRNPSLSLDSEGYIHTVWEDGGKSGVGYQIVMNSAGPFGNRVSGSETTVSPANEITATYSPSLRSDPKISTHKSGRPVVIYADDMDGNKKFQVLAKGLSGTAVTLGAAASAGGAIVKSPDAAFYRPNTVVNITAVPEPGFVFSGWGGDLPSGANPSSPNQTLTLSETKKIRAAFVPGSSVEDSLTRY